MIDFRYHLVSIVAVFLALAVGIIIGATSLQGEVAGTLRGQVTDMRKENATLRSRLDHSQTGGRRQDSFVSEVAPKALAGQLRGRSVAIIALPGTPDSLVSTTATSVTAAGGRVDSRVRLTSELGAGPGEDQRKAVTAAAGVLGVAPQGADVGQLAGRVLADALAGRATQSSRDDALGRLADADLLSVSPDQPPQADGVIVLWPAMDGSSGDSTTTRWAQVITNIGLAAPAGVGVSAGPQEDDLTRPDPLISRLRDSAAVTGAMSTVDAGARPVGQGALVLALRDEYADKSGHFGLADDASGAAPALTAPTP